MEKITAVIKFLIHRSLIALGYRLERIPSRHPAAAKTIGERARRWWRSASVDDDPILRMAKAHDVC